MNLYCAQCGDQYNEMEYRRDDPDEPRFCSDECEDRYAFLGETSTIYDIARYGGASVF